MKLADLEKLALSLTRNERELLATRLLSSLDEVAIDDDLPSGWKETILSRQAEMNSGSEKGVPHDEVYDDIRKELG